jgi:hypothetical protein
VKKISNAESFSTSGSSRRDITRMAYFSRPPYEPALMAGILTRKMKLCFYISAFPVGMNRFHVTSGVIGEIRAHFSHRFTTPRSGGCNNCTLMISQPQNPVILTPIPEITKNKPIILARPRSYKYMVFQAVFLPSAL